MCNYLQRGLLKSIKNTGGNTSISTSTETVLDTITNVAVGTGATIARAVRALSYGIVQFNTGTGPDTVEGRWYYQPGSSFTLGSATVFAQASMDLYTKFDDRAVVFTGLVSLTPGTYSFGLTLQRTVGADTVLARASASYPRLSSIEDIGEGVLVG